MKKYIKKYAKKNKKIEFDKSPIAKVYNLILTVTNRNVLLTLTDLTGHVHWKQSLGGYGVPGYTRRAYHLNYQFGLYFGSYIKEHFPGYYMLNIRGWNSREKAVQRGLFKAGLKIVSILNKTPIAFNGCKKIHKRRK